MKNIHIIPTDKPSRLHLIEDFLMITNEYKNSACDTEANIYITSDEVIRDDDWVYCPVLKKPVFICLDSILMFKNLDYDSNGNSKYKKEWLKKIILTTDPDLIKDGVQAIDDEFLEWFIKNPSCENVKVELIEEIPSGFTFGMFGNDEPPTELVYKIIIPQEEPKQETPEEAAAIYSKHHYANREPYLKELYAANLGFIDGAKWQAERMYSEEEVQIILSKLLFDLKHKGISNSVEWFEQFKKK